MKNMKFKYNIFLMALSVFSLWFVSCDEYRDADELDDQLYLQKSGLLEAKVFNWGTFTYELPVINSATVRLSVDESILAAYNETNGTDYKLMPDNCYSLKEGSLSFTEDDYRKFFLIDFDPASLTDLGNDGLQYVLPCLLVTDNADIRIAEEDKAQILIKPSVYQPYIGFETPGIYRTGSEFSIKTDDDDVLVIYPKVQVNYYNDWDISYDVEVNSAALDEYNGSLSAGARKYKLLPEGAYTIDRSTCILNKNRDYEYLKITLEEKAFKVDENNYAFGYYALPLKIAFPPACGGRVCQVHAVQDDHSGFAAADGVNIRVPAGQRNPSVYDFADRIHLLQVCLDLPPGFCHVARIPLNIHILHLVYLSDSLKIPLLRAAVRSREENQGNLAQNLPLVHLANLQGAAVLGIVAVIAHDKDTVFLHDLWEHSPFIQIGQGVGVILLQREAIYIDNTVFKVHIHDLPFRGDDALDNGLPVIIGLLTEDHNVPLFRLPIEEIAGQKQIVPIQQRLPHRGPGHHDDAEKDQEYDHNHRQHPAQIVQIQHKTLLKPRIFFLLLFGFKSRHVCSLLFLSRHNMGYCTTACRYFPEIKSKFFVRA